MLVILIAGLTTLMVRRERGDAIETFKTLNSFNKVQKETQKLQSKWRTRKTVKKCRQSSTTWSNGQRNGPCNSMHPSVKYCMFDEKIRDTII